MGLALAPGSSEIDIAEVKLRLNKTLTVDDDEIQSMIDAACAAYVRYVAPLPGTVTETLSGGRDALILRSPDASAVTAASYSDGTTISTADLIVENGIVYWGYNTAGYFTAGTRNVTITYTVGALPLDHREAIIADVAGYFAATQRGGGAGPSFASEGYEEPLHLEPQVLFPRILKLAPPSVA